MSVAAGILGATSLAGGVIGAVGSSSAANTQASAANNAANLQYQLGTNSLDFQKQVYGNQQAEIAPYLQTGYSGLANLSNLMGLSPQGSSTAPGWQFPGTGTNQTSTSQVPTGIVPNRGVSMRPGADGQLPEFSGIDQVAGVDGSGNPIAPSGPATSTNQLSTLNSLINPNLGASGSLLAPYPGGQFQAPTADQAKQDPGYQFGLDQGVNALDNSAAARGDLLSGNTARAITQFGNDYASTKYGDVYNRALNNYTTNYNTYQQQQANTYNRLAAMAGLGQTATQQLGNAGQSAASTIANINLGTGSQVGQNINNAGAARASGYTGIANSLSGATGGIGQLALLNSILGGGYNNTGTINPLDMGHG